jgi:hypothetical protein
MKNEEHKDPTSESICPENDRLNKTDCSKEDI